MKKKGIIVLSLILITTLILAGCSGGPSATDNTTSDNDTAIAEANDSLENLKEAFSDGDETAIANSISDDGVTVVDNIEDSPPENYTKEEFINDMSEGPEPILLLNLINKTTEVNGDTVTISGETSASFQLPTGIQTTQPASLTKYNTTNPITTQDTYNGTNFSVEHPNNWYSISLSETTEELLMAIPSGQQKTSLVIWEEGVFTSTTLNELMSDLNDILSNMESKTDLPNLDDVTFTPSDNTDYTNAKDYTATYDYNYIPIILEIEMQKEGNTYKITQITVGQSSSVKTVSVTEKGIVINKNDNMYFISYGGNDEVYNETEADNIFSSFDIE